MPDKYSEVEGNCILVADDDMKLAAPTHFRRSLVCTGICDARSDFSYNAIEQNCSGSSTVARALAKSGRLPVRHPLCTSEDSSISTRAGAEGNHAKVNSMSLTLDMCKAVCDGLYEACFGFSQNAANMTYVLQQDESHTTCKPGTTPQRCTLL